MSTIYYCVPCLTHFKCKKNLSDKDKQQREKEYLKTGVPQSCKESNIDCKRVLPKIKEEFAVLEKLGLTYISGQYESTDSGKFYEQAYFQFEKCQTITSVKKIFNHQAMNFPKYLNGDSDKNRDYSQKTWNRYKDPNHKKKCPSELSNVENGPWEFGIYRYLGTSSELKKSDDTLNEKRLEDIERINHIIENDLTIDDILKNKKDLLLR
ncbi:19275_t:CDS:2, partial [Racocetra fulgida]